MKIAVVFGGTKPSFGGGFTFEDDLLRSIVELAPHQAHEFVLVGSFDGATRESLAASGNLSLVESKLGRTGRLGRAASTLSDAIPLLGRAAGLRSGLDRLLEPHGVEWVWFVTPFYFYTDHPYLYTVWDLQHRLQPYFPELRTRARWEHRDRFYGQAVGRAALVIAANGAARSELERFYGIPPERVRTLPHPTPAFALQAALHPKPPPAGAMKGVPEYFLYPSHFQPHKNHAGLLQAIAIAKRELAREIHVALVGPETANVAHLKAMARSLEIDRQVHFLGFVDRESLTALYRNASGLVYPSYFGPENLPPLEAFALGCPVIASRVSGSEEQLGDAALLVDPTDFEGFASAMVSLSGDPARREDLIAKGKVRAARWTARDYTRAVFADLDRFARVRLCWR